jgi:hypothetical protein
MVFTHNNHIQNTVPQYEWMSDYYLTPLSFFLDYAFDIWCFSAKNAALKSTNKDWLTGNQDIIVSVWVTTSISDHCCFSELALWKSKWEGWSRAKLTSSFDWEKKRQWSEIDVVTHADTIISWFPVNQSLFVLFNEHFFSYIVKMYLKRNKLKEYHYKCTIKHFFLAIIA